jgi:hypothetical protein
MVDKLTDGAVNAVPGIDTEAGFARLMGMTRQAVNKAKQEGRISGDAITPDGRIVVARAAQQLGRPLPGAAGVPAADPAAALSDDPLYAQSRARREAANAELAELELRIRRGQFLDRTVVARMVTGFFTEVRDGSILAVLNNPDRPDEALHEFFTRKADDLTKKAAELDARAGKGA